MFHPVISARHLPTFLSEASPITFKCIMTLNRFCLFFFILNVVHADFLSISRVFDQNLVKLHLLLIKLKLQETLITLPTYWE